jgi:hypothetical protein
MCCYKRQLSYELYHTLVACVRFYLVSLLGSLACLLRLDAGFGDAGGHAGLEVRLDDVIDCGQLGAHGLLVHQRHDGLVHL